MARGIDTSKHPNRKVGRSDLPRLSGALANHLNDSMESHMEDYDDPEEGKDEFSMSHSIPSLIGNPYGKPLSELDTANALSKYRQQRNSGQMDSEGKALYGEDIRDAYRNR